MPVEVTGQRAEVLSRKPGDCDPLNPEGLIAKAFVARYKDDPAMLQQFWLQMGSQQALVQAQRRERTDHEGGW